MSERRTPWKLSFWIAAVLVGLGAFFFWIHGWSRHQHALTSLTWTTQRVEDLTIEAPFTFQPVPDILEKLPPDLRAAVATWVNHEGVLAPDRLRAQVSHVTYHEGVALDLDGAVEGAISNAAAALGDRDPKHTATPVQISGLEARRVGYTSPRRRNRIYTDTLFIHRGQELWQVQTFVNAEALRPAAARILDSARLAPPAEPATSATLDAPDRVAPPP